jgi:hypothetical protein
MIVIIKSRITKWAGHVRTGDEKYNTFFSGNLKEINDSEDL